MDDATRLGLVAVAIARGATHDQAWALVDEVAAETSDVRAASAATYRRASSAAWGGVYVG